MKNPAARNLALWAAALLFAAACAGRPAAPANLLSFDAAMAEAVSAVEANVPGGAEIALAKFDAPLEVLAGFLNDELSGRFNAGGVLTVLARGKDLQRVDREHDFQMSGLVSDESAVGIGRYLGAKVVITGAFDRFASFSQFRIRAVDVETGALLAMYSARIDNRDAVLAAVSAPLAARPAAAITENALDHLNRGKDLYAEGKDDEAIAEFDRAIAINRKLSEAFLYRGNTYYYLKGDPDRAIADYNRALRINPNYAAAYMNRGNAYDDKGDPDRAIADYNRALRINPDYAVAYYNRGVAYSDKGDLDRAIADYTQALRINPNFAFAYNNRGSAYSDKGDLDRAIADYNQALRIDPNFALAYNNRGKAYNRQGDTERAAADFSQALRINPNYVDAWYNRGFLYLAEGYLYDQAIDDFTQALRINPNHDAAHNFRGIAYAIIGDLNRAIADYEAALRINPGYADARTNLARARQRLGR
ncbi:MAG: tetratricopeptide repeat protein [Spirochaetales bacterium]|jgi:tetratricopeptide (TPR) repeat protein|nr:tetratricopeptide repeat protein [Spirochaetales bacterium]